MADTIAQMSKKEFQKFFEEIIENKLYELLGDPDEGLKIRKKINERLLRQREAVKKGKRGNSFETVVRQFQQEQM
jgi:hypothetical protein